MNFYDELIDKIAATHSLFDALKQLTEVKNRKDELGIEYDGQLHAARRAVKKHYKAQHGTEIGDVDALHQQWLKDKATYERLYEEGRRRNTPPPISHGVYHPGDEYKAGEFNQYSGGSWADQHVDDQFKQDFKNHFGEGYNQDSTRFYGDPGSAAHAFGIDSNEAKELVSKNRRNKYLTLGGGALAGLAALGISDVASAKDKNKYHRAIKDASKVNGRTDRSEQYTVRDLGHRAMQPYALKGLAGGVAAGALLAGASGLRHGQFAKEYNKLVAEGKTHFAKDFTAYNPKSEAIREFSDMMMPMGMVGGIAGAGIGERMGYGEAAKKVREYKEQRDKAASYTAELEKEALGLPKIPVPKVVQDVGNKINNTAVKAYTKVNSHPVGHEFINDVHRVLTDPSGVGPDNIAGLGAKWIGHGAQHVYNTVNSFEHYPGVKPIVKKIFNPPRAGWRSPEQYDLFNSAGEEPSALQKLALMGTDKARENYENAGLRYITEGVDPYAEEWYDKTKLEDANTVRDVLVNKYQKQYGMDGLMLGGGALGVLGGFAGRRFASKPALGGSIGAGIGIAAGSTGGAFLGHHAGTAKGYNQAANVLNGAADELEDQEYLEETKE